MDINVPIADGIFVCRAAAIILFNHKILLETSQGVDFWAPPGGTVAFNEASQETLIRELEEELDIAVGIERLLWVSEGFFSYKNKPTHALIWYYLVSLDPTAPLLQQEQPFQRYDKNNSGPFMTFKWHPIDELKGINISPPFLKNRLYDLPQAIEHIVYR